MTFLSPFLFLFLFLHVRAEMNSSRQSSVSSANASSLLFPNTTSTSNSSFSCIIPYGQTQDCDIYGSPCQTGSITVGVDLTTATTTTILPCSSYLSAQSAYLWNEMDSGDDDGFWPGFEGGLDVIAWDLNFGRSPQCRSYAEALSRGQSTFSSCGSSNTASANYLLEDMPGLNRYFYPTYQGTCCGNCSLSVPEVRLYYFPDKSTMDCHRNQTFNLNSTLSAQNLEKRVHSLIANGSTAVFSGHTFTSPSIYLQLMGTATINDQCTTVGPKLIDPIITLPPGGLSTWRPDDNAFNFDNFTVGEVWEDPSGIPSYDIAAGIAPLDVRDLICPTWGLGTSTSADGTVITTIGSPWLPLIVPPVNIFSLDPTWSSVCTGIFSDNFGLTTFALFDPPIALTPAPLLLPTPPARPTTSVPEQATPSREAAKPASLPNDPAAPAKTGDPGKETATKPPAIASADPAGSASLPENSAASSKNEGDPPADPPADPKAPSIDGDPHSPSGPDSTPANSQQPPTDPKVPIVPIPQPVEDPQTQAQGLGAIIYNAFGKTGPKPDGSSAVLLPPQSIFAVGAQIFTANPAGFKVNGAAIAPDGSIISLTDPSATPVLAVAGQTFTPDPSAFAIAGTIVSAGGPAVTVDGTAISLGQSGALAIGSTTISLAPPSTNAFTVAGQNFTPNPSAFSIAGTAISADGPAVTIGGTIVSLGQHGALKIGSSTISLSTPSDSFPSKVYTVAGQVFTPNPSAFPIAGTTISAGGPAVTVDGSIISLGQSGALAIGSSTVDLLSPVDNSFGQAYTVAGQIFTPNPSAFSIAGATIFAGGPALTLDGTIISLEPSDTLVVGSSTIPLLPLITSASGVDVDGFAVIAYPSFAVVDGVTVSAAAAGVIVSGKVVSLEPGGATLDIGTGRFALPTPAAAAAANGSVNVQAFVGGQSKRSGMSLYLVGCVCGALMLLM